MRLMDYLRQFYVERIPPFELEQILKGRSLTHKAENNVPGTIVVKSTDKNLSPYQCRTALLGCVKEYFTADPSGKKLKSTRCFGIHKDLGLKDVKHGDCKRCFLKCLSADGSKAIVKMKNK